MADDATKYRVMVIDPPWDIGGRYSSASSASAVDRYKKKHGYGFNTRTANANVQQRRGMPYRTMTDDELRALELPVVVDTEGSCLFLWTVHQKLDLARELIRIWGF